MYLNKTSMGHIVNKVSFILCEKCVRITALDEKNKTQQIVTLISIAEKKR